MSEPPVIRTQPPEQEDVFLYESFREEIVKQVDRLDDLARELFKIELAIPGLYVTVLKLVDSTATASPLLIKLALVAWLMALMLTLAGLFPQKYSVMSGVTRHQGDSRKQLSLTIKEFYKQSSIRKYRFLLAATLCFFLGVSLAAFAVL